MPEVPNTDILVPSAEKIQKEKKTAEKTKKIAVEAD